MLRTHKYYKSKRRANFEQAPIKRPKPGKLNIKKVKTIVGAVFFLTSFFWFIYFFFLSNNFAVKTIIISGNENIPDQELKNIIQSQLNQKRLFLLQNRNMLLFDKEKAIQDIQDKFIVDNIKITRNFPFTLEVELEEKLARVVLRAKTPIYITKTEDEALELLPEQGMVAGEDVSHNIENGGEKKQETAEEPDYKEEYYYLDVNGIVVSSSKSKPDDGQGFPVIEIEISQDQKIKTGDTMLDREKIEFIFNAYEAIESSAANIKVSYVIYNEKKSNELVFATTELWQGFLSTDVSLETQIKKLELAMDEKIKDQRAYLQYVDLRIKDRVYFK